MTSTANRPLSIKVLPILLLLSALVGIAIIGVILSEQNGCGIILIGSGILPSILSVGIYLGKWVILAALVFSSILYFVAHPKETRRTASSLLILNVGVLLMSVILVVKGQDFRFALYRAAYDEVIQLVEEGKIEFDEWGGALLPPEYQHLSSCGGAIQANFGDGVTRVFFFSTLTDGISFDGIVYRSDNKLPMPTDYLIYMDPPYLGDWKCERKGSNWFYCKNTFYLDSFNEGQSTGPG